MEAFWRSVYAKGDSLMSYNTATFSVYGVRAFDILSHHAKVKGVPLKYKLASSLLLQRGVALDHRVIQGEIESIARAEAVPPWEKAQWDDLLQSFQMCEVVHGEDPVLPIPADHVRLCFTHQLFEENISKEMVEALRTRMAKDAWEEIMDDYKKTHLDWLEKQRDFLNQKLDDSESLDVRQIAKTLLKELHLLQPPQFDKAKKYVSGMKNLLHVVKTYFCMQTLVVVCSIRQMHVEHVNSMTMGWVSVLAKALAQRREFMAKVVEMYPASKEEFLLGVIHSHDVVHHAHPKTLPARGVLSTCLIPFVNPAV
jgi:hypothetical protein